MRSRFSEVFTLPLWTGIFVFVLLFQRSLNLLVHKYSSSLVPAEAGWASWAQRLELGEAQAHPAFIPGTGGGWHPVVTALETAGKIAVPEPGFHVYGVEDMDAVMPSYLISVYEHASCASWPEVTTGSRKENHQWYVCNREIM